MGFEAKKHIVDGCRWVQHYRLWRLLLLYLLSLENSRQLQCFLVLKVYLYHPESNTTPQVQTSEEQSL